MQSSLKLSDLLFRKFMRAYPAEYRQQFTEEMRQLFRDLCRDAYRDRGAAGLAILWVTTLMDLLKTAFEERIQLLPLPSAKQLTQVGSVAAIFGGLTTFVFAATHASPNWIDWVFRLEWVFPTLGSFYLAGLIGLGAQLSVRGKQVRVDLAIALIGAGIMAVSGFLMLFLNQVWISFGSGLLIMAGGMLATGLFTLRYLNDRQLNHVVLSNGILTFLLTLFLPFRYMGALFEGDTALFAALSGVSWIGLGFVLLTRSVGKIEH